MRSFLALLRRRRVALLVTSGLLLSYTLAGFLLVPWLARTIIQGQVEKIGRHVEIGRIAFNPYSFEAQIASFKLTEADGKPLVVFNHLLVNAELAASIWNRGVVLKEIWLSKPDISLIVEADGSLNLAKLAPPSNEPPDPKPASLPRIHIGSFAVEFGRIGIEDRSRPQPFSTALEPIAFALNDFRTDPGYGNAYSFTGTATTGEELEWKGEFSVQPLGSTGTFALRKVQTSTIGSYLQDQLPLQLVSGVGELAGSYQLTMSPALSLDVALPSIIVRQLAVAERGASALSPPVSIAELGVHGVALSLAKRDVAVQKVEIKGAQIAATRERDGSLNLSRLATPPASSRKPAAVAPPPAKASNAEAEAAWHVAVASIQLSGSAVKVEDASVSPAMKLSLSPIAATIRGFSTDTDAKLKIDSDIGIGADGRLLAQGDVQLQPLSARMALNLTDFGLPVIQHYLAQSTALTLQSGRLGVKGQLNYVTRKDAPAQLTFTGDASVGDLLTQDLALKQDLVKWSALQISGIDFSQAPDRLSIERVALTQPSARVVIAPDRSINVTQILKTKTATPAPVASKISKPAAKPANAAPPMPMQIKTISIDKGQLSFADRSIEPNFAAAIRDLKGSITGLSTAANSRAKIQLDGKVDKFSPVVIRGEIAPLASKQYIDIALSFRNMELTRFNPYSGRFAGYNITKGKLTTELKYKIQDRALEAEHHVVLDQLEFGDATGSKDAVPLPIKLAVALLKDRHGVIDLQLPVRGSLDDPAFKIGTLVWKTFTNLLTRVVTAPFAALGSLFGGGEELAYVDFAPGVATLSPDETGKLEKLATALVERPQLKLDIPLTLDEPRDQQALVSAALEQRLGTFTAVNYAGTTPKDRLRSLEKMYRELWGSSVKYPPEVEADKENQLPRRTAYLEQALSERTAPNPAELEKLARQRARTVQSALLAHTEIAPERVFLTARNSAGKGDQGAVRMELKLE